MMVGRRSFPMETVPETGDIEKKIAGAHRSICFLFNDVGITDVTPKMEVLFR